MAVSPAVESAIVQQVMRGLQEIFDDNDGPSEERWPNKCYKYRYHIGVDIEDIEFLRSMRFSYTKTAEILGVSRFLE